MAGPGFGVQPMRVGVEKWSDMIQDGVLVHDTP